MLLNTSHLQSVRGDVMYSTIKLVSQLKCVSFAVSIYLQYLYMGNNWVSNYAACIIGGHAQ